MAVIYDFDEFRARKLDTKRAQLIKENKALKKALSELENGADPTVCSNCGREKDAEDVFCVFCENELSK